MVTVRFIFLAICFLLSVLQSSHARDDTRVLSHVVSRENSAGLCSKMFVGAMYALQGAEYAIVGAAAGPIGVVAKFATQESAAFVIETTIEESRSKAAKLITQCETLQQEFQNTIKLCAYAGMCAGSVKASKKLVSSLSKNVVERVSMHDLQRKVGNVGTFRELTKGAPFHDGKQAHHIPVKSFMQKYGIHKDDGLAIMITNEQHAKTRTFKGKAKNIPADATTRDELARDLRDVRRIMKEDGTYTKEVNRNLMDGVKDFKEKFPDVFKKEQK